MTAGRSAAGDFDTNFARIYRTESARCLATLVRVLGDVDAAEDAVADAFAVAAERWPVAGFPANPGGWITTTARNRAIDRLRRESKRNDRQTAAHRLQEIERTEAPMDGPELNGPADGRDDPDGLGPLDVVPDDQLRLIFLCCHPALAREAQVAMTLRLVAGLQTPEIARAFLVPEPTMAQRLVRAKNKIRHNRIAYRLPGAAALPDRLGPVLATLYLVFNEGHTASFGPDLTRSDLSGEAIRLARLLYELMPDEPEVLGLLALLLLSEARRPARVGPDGSLVRLADQDRSRWDRDLIVEGHQLVRRCLRRNQPGPYQIQAAIAAVHADAPRAADTDWGQIVALYDQLRARGPNPVVELNRAIAVAERDGPQAGLDALDGVDLDRYHLYHATRAELLARLDRRAEAAAAYDAALARATNDAERRHLATSRARLN